MRRHGQRIFWTGIEPLKRYFVLALLLMIAPPATMERFAPARAIPVRLTLDAPAVWPAADDWAPATPVGRDPAYLDLRDFEIDDVRVRVNVRPDGVKVTGTWRY